MAFKNSFTGNPKAMIDQLISSGRISKTQYDQAVQMAQQMKNMLGFK